MSQISNGLGYAYLWKPPSTFDFRHVRHEIHPLGQCQERFTTKKLPGQATFTTNGFEWTGGGRLVSGVSGMIISGGWGLKK